MSRRPFSILLCVASACLFAITVGCDSGSISNSQDSDAELRGQKGFDNWIGQYNDYIAGWLDEQVAGSETKINDLKGQLSDLQPDADSERAKLTESVAAQEAILDRMNKRIALGDYIATYPLSELPAGLKWEDGQNEPEIGDPNAKKGGTFRYWIPSFPPNIRPIGSNSNHSFRGEIYDNVEVALTKLHPETGGNIPGVAKEWAIGQNGQTCFYRLDPDAAYNDGVKVEAVDFHWWVYLRAADYTLSPWFKQYIREQIAQVAIYGDDIIAITLPDPKPNLVYSGAIYPSAKHFYAEYGPDYEERYQWRVPPTTGAYTVLPEDLRKGVSVTLSRQEDWWARDKKFYRYRYNVDRIRYLVIRDMSKAWELFRAGEIDYFPITLPEYWYEKSEMPPVFNGYIERYTWYNQYPRLPWALYLNTQQGLLKEHEVRQGVCHATNWQKVIDVVFRGDATRLPGWTKGYGEIDNPEIKARPFSVADARKHFAAAGFTEEGSDGILRRKDGKRLEVVLTYTKVPVRDRMMGILKEEARKAGLDIVLDAVDGTISFKKVSNKEHEMTFTAWGFQPPYPRYFEYFHSSNALDDKGKLKPNTNNVFSYGSERMDKLTSLYRNASSEAELIEYGREMQQIIHDAAIFIPGYMTEFSRIGCWRWVRWPDSEFTEFCPPKTYVPFESYVYWIDDEMKDETIDAKRSGKTFPEVQETKDRYRQ